MGGRDPKRKRWDRGEMLGDQHGRCPLYQAVCTAPYCRMWRQEASLPVLALPLVLLAYCNFWNSYFACMANREPKHVGGNQMRKYMEKTYRIKHSVRNGWLHHWL